MLNSGDTAWVLASAALVMLMTPGLAFFYGGMVRSKSVLNMLMMNFIALAVVGTLWFFYGFSFSFANDINGAGLLGGFDFVGLENTAGKLAGFAVAANPDTGTAAVAWPGPDAIPVLAFCMFQLMFAVITPALISGAVADRLKFWSWTLFVALWVTFVYFPIAHMVWCWDGPDAFAKAALAGQSAIDAVSADSGFLYNKGALDFAGGTVVHINAGITGLVMCIMLGKRLGYPNEPMPPHSLTMTMIGASLLWVGWFGFNAGSNLEASSIASVAFMNTMIATAAAGMSWLLVEQAVKGKPSLLGAASGVVAGLVAVTPASGYAGTMGSVILGLMVSPICFFFVTVVKSKFGYDDSLDVFGVHCIGGITGAIMTGILDNPAFGGQGIADYTTKPGTMVAGTYDMVSQVITQIEAVGITLVWSGLGAAILFFVIDKVWGFRVSPEVEHEGLDIAEHGERAYHY